MPVMSSSEFGEIAGRSNQTVQGMPFIGVYRLVTKTTTNITSNSVEAFKTEFYKLIF